MLDPQATVGDVGERGLLRHLRGRIPGGAGVRCGIGDDAAVVDTADLTLVTTDCMVEGTHFRRDWMPAELLGRKVLSINLSDVAAMSGVPRYATVNLCLPRDLTVGFVDGLYDGLLARAAEAGLSLVGGNLAAIDGPVVIDVTLLGTGDKIMRRSGAFPGDVVVVTGSLGAAAEGLRLLQQGARLSSDGQLVATGVWTDSSAPALTHCLRAHLDPSPPLAFGRSLAEHDLVHAGLDISDGLSSDLLELCHESGVAARLDVDCLPMDPHMAALERARGGDPHGLALHGGEDYQLLLALPADNVEPLRKESEFWNVTVTQIGELIEGQPQVLLHSAAGDVPLEATGYEHFVAPDEDAS